MSLTTTPASVNHLSAAQLPLFPDDAPIKRDFRLLPNTVAQHFRDAGLTYGQACLVNNIRSHARKGRLPAPSLERVAAQLHTDTRQVQRWLHDLEGKDLVVVQKRVGIHGGQLSSAYDFTPLFRLCERIAAAQRADAQAEPAPVPAPPLPDEQIPLMWGGTPAPTTPVEIVAEESMEPVRPAESTTVAISQTATSLAETRVPTKAAAPTQGVEGVVESPRGGVVKNTTPSEIGTSVPRRPTRKIDPPTPTRSASEPARPQLRLSPDEQLLVAPVERIAAELGDRAALLSTVRQLDALRGTWGLSAPAFLALLAEARLYVREAIRARQRRRTLAPIGNPMGYYLTTLEQLCRDTVAPPPPRPPRRERKMRRHQPEPEGQAGASSSPPASAASAASPPNPNAPAPAFDTWGQVCAELAPVMTPENYARWFVPARQLADDGDALTVAVPDDFHRRWLGERLRRQVDTAAAAIRPGLHVAFVARGVE